mmetsp:Transcript_50879/g.135815  ORF Transcript_50879/g.135815 Transcript_50879/m.135815 type:complete len:221 (-) Transcript_50879:114-776(-)
MSSPGARTSGQATYVVRGNGQSTSLPRTQPGSVRPVFTPQYSPVGCTQSSQIGKVGSAGSGSVPSTVTVTPVGAGHPRRATPAVAARIPARSHVSQAPAVSHIPASKMASSGGGYVTSKLDSHQAVASYVVSAPPVNSPAIAVEAVEVETIMPSVGLSAPVKTFIAGAELAMPVKTYIAGVQPAMPVRTFIAGAELAGEDEVNDAVPIKTVITRSLKKRG